jgi:proline iminopeptidase
MMLRVSALHRLHVEVSGNPSGRPVVLLHGGPGGLPDPRDLDFFDAGRLRRVVFHQRGSGLSRPLGELRENTLDHLASDIELLRAHLGVSRWIVFGGSFGAALALHYAQTCPGAVQALIVHSVLIGRPGFESWDFDASRHIDADGFARLAAAIPGPPDQPLAARCFAAILRGGRDGARATRAWYARSAVLSNLSPDCAPASQRQTPGQARAAARLSALYWQNRLFLPPGALLARANRLCHLSGAIVHGAADRNTLPDDARDLARAWPRARFDLVDGAGHSARDPGMARALHRAVAALS